jgi:hypothetical protein
MGKGRKCGRKWGSYHFLFIKKIVKHFVQCHVFAQSPPDRRPNDKYPVNTSHRSQFVCTCFIAVLFGSNGNSNTVSYVHKHTYSSQCRDASRANEIKNGRAVNTACQGNLSAHHFGHACHRFVSPVVGLFIQN